MKIKMCQFLSPDLCEFWTGPFTTLSIEITENQFKTMKTQIEKDQNAKEHVYQLFKDNCVQYAMSIIRLAGITFPTEIHLSDLLIRHKTLKKAQMSILESKLIPSFVKKGLQVCWIMSLNWVSLILGAGMIDPEVSFLHFFKQKKSIK
jgi:hypothetical protein